MKRSNFSYRFGFCGVILTAAMIGQAAAAEIIFNDDFTSVPSNNGYAIEGGSDFTVTAVTGAGNNPAENTAVKVAKSVSGTKVYSITQTIDAQGFEDLAIEFKGFQSNTTYEQTDNLRILVSSDGGDSFTTIFNNPGPFDNDNDDSDGNGGFVDSGVQASTSSGVLELGSSFDDSVFQVRIGITVNANTEEYFFDQLTVTGTQIPEPGSLSLVALGGLMMIRFRR
jgi:hypothetical protein